MLLPLDFGTKNSRIQNSDIQYLGMKLILPVFYMQCISTVDTRKPANPFLNV